MNANITLDTLSFKEIDIKDVFSRSLDISIVFQRNLLRLGARILEEILKEPGR